MAVEVVVPISIYQKYIKPKLVDEEFKKKRYEIIQKCELARRHNNAEYKELVNQRAKDLYKNNVEYQERKKQKMREYQKKRTLEKQNKV